PAGEVKAAPTRKRKAPTTDQASPDEALSVSQAVATPRKRGRKGKEDVEDASVKPIKELKPRKVKVLLMKTPKVPKIKEPKVKLPTAPKAKHTKISARVIPARKNQVMKGEPHWKLSKPRPLDLSKREAPVIPADRSEVQPSIWCS
ncbi:hypothetical protein C0991_011630, partial [Blastosporella zonata]